MNQPPRLKDMNDQDMNDQDCNIKTIDSYYLAARRRALRQLIESMLFENILVHTNQALPDGDLEFSIVGIDVDGYEVRYLSKGNITESYGRIRLHTPTIRESRHSRGEASSIALFLAEAGQKFEYDEVKFSSFIAELSNTVVKDAAALKFNSNLSIDSLVSFDDFESSVTNGHLYHPCYKSRIGFNLQENEAYTNDFRPFVNFFWIAIRRERAKIYVVDGIDFDSLIATEIEENILEKFKKSILQINKKIEDYIFLPVHPWQWKEKIVLEYVDEIACGDLIPLGFHPDQYSPQQSLRSLSNHTRKNAYTVKVALSIINTSADRLLSPHNVANSAIVSDWLGRLLNDDTYLKQVLDFSFVKEVAGIYDDKSHLPSVLEKRRFGLIGTIWRESIYQYIRPGDCAMPATALCFVDANGQAVADDWIQKHGLRFWIANFLEVMLTPFIHLLYAHGIAFEAHAQNTILIFRDGLPTRVAVRDLPGGIRFSREYLQAPETCPMLLDAPNYRLSPGERSVLDATPDEVVWYFHDAIFFVHIAEIAHFFNTRHELPESEFWGMVSGTILRYQDKFPELKARFSALDLFQPKIRISQFARRKIFEGIVSHAYQVVSNPLKYQGVA